MSKKCKLCGKQESVRSSFASFMDGPGDIIETIKGEDYCVESGNKYIKDNLSKILITTTNNIDGYKVKKYIGIHSVEIVIGTGMFSEFGGEIADFFGRRSTAFENKLAAAKIAALNKLKYIAFKHGGNAAIGVDLDYTEFSGNRIGLIANGTVVEVIPINE